MKPCFHCKIFFVFTCGRWKKMVARHPCNIADWKALPRSSATFLIHFSARCAQNVSFGPTISPLFIWHLAINIKINLKIFHFFVISEWNIKGIEKKLFSEWCFLVDQRCKGTRQNKPKLQYEKKDRTNSSFTYFQNVLSYFCREWANGHIQNSWCAKSEVRWPWKHWRQVSSFFKKEPPLVNLLGTQGWLTDRQKRPKNRLWNYFRPPPLFSCSNEMRRVLADFASSEISKQVETRMILCWLLLFIQPLLIRLIAQCRRSPHHHLPNAMPWRYLPKDNHATFETCKKTHHHWENISKALQPGVVQSTTL